MKLRKIAKFIFFLAVFFLVFPSYSLARNNSFITIVNPVRGSEFGNIKTEDVLSGINILKKAVGENSLKATWLLRFDILSSPQLSEYFKSDFSNQELGIFMEVTPKQAQLVGVSYPKGGVFWHDSNKIFLSGYKPEERIRLIDRSFSQFKEIFGYYPKSVGAWHIDAFSAEYMREKYGVVGILICADQFGTDNYQIWGGWWGVPYYPSKYNILAPAQSLKNKLDLVVSWWAARDPVKGYGGSGEESSYSVQVNDYIGHGLDINYFKKLLDVYLNDERNLFGQVTVGLENDSDWKRIGNGYELQMNEVKRREVEDKVEVATMSEFSEWYRRSFKNTSPSHRIGEWFMSTNLRLGIMEKNGQKFISDLRVYNEKWPEANYLSANPWRELSLNNPYKIDTVRFEDSAAKLNSGISNEEQAKSFGKQEIPFAQNSFFLLLFYSFTLVLLVWFLRNNLPLLMLVVFGSLSLSLTMIKSGLAYPFGMGFWGPNGHDGIWHVALINQLAKFSLVNPVFPGRELTNYHFGFDFLAAILSRLTGIIPVNMYFQILPPMMAILIGALTYKFVEKWLGSKKSAWWAAFFVYFGSSWGWLVSLIKTGKLGGESIFWANQSISTLINPPYALSLIFLLLGMIKFLDYLKDPNRKNLLICSLFLGVLVQIKVYAGVIVLGSLFCLLFINSVRRFAGVKEIFKLFILSLLVSLVVFLPFNSKASSLLVFSPLWFPHTMLAFSDRFGWFKLENARQAYFASGNWAKWILTEGLAIIIFIFGNLGTRIFGFLGGSWIKNFRKISQTEIFLIMATAISLFLPLIFIQKGNPWNTIQFFYYFQFFTGIFAGLAMGKLWEAKLPRLPLYFISLLVVILTLPTTFSTLMNDYLPSRPPSRVSVEELEALKFLQNQQRGIVLTFPFNSEWRNIFSEPKPLYAYETTAYVSALGDKEVFLEDEMNLEISDYDWQGRKKDSLKFFYTNDQVWADVFLKENKIKYIYLVKGQKMNLGLNDINGKKVFENGEVVISRIN